MQAPIQSNYPRARLGGEQDDQQYAALQLRAYVLLNSLVAAQVGLVFCTVLTLITMNYWGIQGSGPTALAFAIGLGLVCVMLCARLARLFRQSCGWSKSYATNRIGTILVTTPVGIGVFQTWKLRREVESELLKFGVEKGMFGLGIDVAKAEEHLFNLRLKKAVPEGLAEEMSFEQEEQIIRARN